MASTEAICPICDHIIDASFLEGASEPPAEDGGDDEKTAARAPIPTRRPPSARPSTARANAPRPRSPASPEPDLSGKDEEEARVERPRSVRPLGVSEAAHAADPEQVLSSITTFLRELPRPDRLAFWGSMGTVVMCFMPWKETYKEGEVLGMATLGCLTFAAAAGTIVAIILRRRVWTDATRAMGPVLAQFGTACFTLLWTVLCLRLFWDSRTVATYNQLGDVVASHPSFGAWCALLTAGVAITGSFTTLRELHW